MTQTAVRFAAFRSGATTADAFSLFDGLAPIDCGSIRGRWAGHELATGSAWDGKLGAAGWQGKEFTDDDSVHPALFTDRHGQPFPIDPRWVPIGLADRVSVRAVEVMAPAIGWLRPLIRARRPGARLRTVEYRGIVTAAMVYDHLPIIDVFRRVDDDTLLGVMDRRGAAPYFFGLTRV